MLKSRFPITRDTLNKMNLTCTTNPSRTTPSTFVVNNFICQLQKSTIITALCSSRFYRDFPASSTATDVISGIDLHGKSIIVTGGYAGIGAGNCKSIIKANAEILSASRNVVKASSNLAGIPHVTVKEMDTDGSSVY